MIAKLYIASSVSTEAKALRNFVLKLKLHNSALENLRIIIKFLVVASYPQQIKSDIFLWSESEGM